MAGASPRPVHWTRNSAAPYVLVGLGVVVLLSSFNGCNKLEGEKQTLEERTRVAESKLSTLVDQNTSLQTELTKTQADTATEQKLISALKAQVGQAKRNQDKALSAQRQQLQKESSQQVAKLQAALATARAQPAATEPPQGDAGYVPNDTLATEATPAEISPAAPTGSDLAFAFQNRCLEAVQAYFDGAEVNQTSGGMATPRPWTEGSPYWFWNVNIRVSGTEHVEPFKCRSSRDQDFELLEGW